MLGCWRKFHEYTRLEKWIEGDLDFDFQSVQGKCFGLDCLDQDEKVKLGLLHGRSARSIYVSNREWGLEGRFRSLNGLYSKDYSKTRILL